MNSVLRLLASLCFAVVLSGCMIVNIPLQIPPSDYQEIVVREGKRDKILLLDIDGTITSGRTESNPLYGASLSTVNQVAEKLAMAKEDSNIKGLILRIDSPGGGVTASDVVYKMLEEYKEETGDRIYTSMLDVAASGGYYIAMSSDKIHAHPTSITGSIGVIAMFPQLEQLGNKIGVSMEVVKSGKNKDVGSPFHDMEPGERKILQDMIDEMYEQFIGIVIESRGEKVPAEKLRELADGRIYTAKQAEAEGLIDGVKYLDDTIDEMAADLGLVEPTVVMYRKTRQDRYESVYAKATPIYDELMATNAQKTNVGLNIDLGDIVAPQEPVFQYLWLP